VLLHITSNFLVCESVVAIHLGVQLASACEMNDDTPWDQDAEENGHWYSSNGGDSPSPSLASSDTSLISWAFQAALPPIVVQHGRAASPQSVASTMHSLSSFALARYLEPHYHPYYGTPDHSSTNSFMSMGGFVPQVRHDQLSPPHVQHQPAQVQVFHGPSVYDEVEDFLRTTTTTPSPAQVQMQAFLHDDSPMDLHQPSPAEESPLNEYSMKSPRGKELFVCHLPSEMTDEELRDLFSQYGVVIRVSIVRHKPEPEESRSFAFVKFEKQIDADEALLRLNDYEVSKM
jgi:hypothetical protein